MLTETPAADPSARGSDMLQLPAPGHVSWDTGEHARADSVRLTERILADADQQAAAIRQEASSQAVAIRKAAEQEAAEIGRQAAPIREAAEREAAEIKRQAAAQVAAIREAVEHEVAQLRQQAVDQAAALRQAAEQEAAELRDTLTGMTSELNRLAESLRAPRQTAHPPDTRPGTVPDGASHPAARAPSHVGSRTRSEAGMGAASAEADDAVATPQAPVRPTRPERPVRPDRPARPEKTAPATKGRQRNAMRLSAAAMAVPITIGILSAAGEIVTHGFGLFAFRSPGTGATQQQGNNGALGSPAPTHHHAPRHGTPSSNPSPGSIHHLRHHHRHR